MVNLTKFSLSSNPETHNDAPMTRNMTFTRLGIAASQLLRRRAAVRVTVRGRVMPPFICTVLRRLGQGQCQVRDWIRVDTRSLLGLGTGFEVRSGAWFGLGPAKTIVRLVLSHHCLSVRLQAGFAGSSDNIYNGSTRHMMAEVLE